MKIIQLSKSARGAPYILLRNPLENEIRQPPPFVVDYRGLESVTKGDGSALPSIPSIPDYCDLASGYWQIPRPSPQKCLLYSRLLRLPFELETAPNTFQRIVNMWAQLHQDALRCCELLFARAAKVSLPKDSMS